MLVPNPSRNLDYVLCELLGTICFQNMSSPYSRRNLHSRTLRQAATFKTISLITRHTNPMTTTPKRFKCNLQRTIWVTAVIVEVPSGRYVLNRSLLHHIPFPFGKRSAGDVLGRYGVCGGYADEKEEDGTGCG
jgi:hypothetical protein